MFLALRSTCMLFVLCVLACCLSMLLASDTANDGGDFVYFIAFDMLVK